MSQIDEIKSRIDILDLISESVKLRRAGKNYSGLCPFHTEKTPSFIVSPDRQTWHCFGQCAEGGDVFKFVMKKEGWDFKEALRYLAGKAGVTLTTYTPQQQEEKDAHERLRAQLEEAVTFYRHQLLNTADGQSALTYLREKRHLTDAVIETFGLGYAPQGWDNALKHFTAKGYSQQDLIDTGLLTVRDDADDPRNTYHATRVYDRFRDRIMIPIRDEQGRMAGFGARILNPDDVPKFLNSPETPLFSKSRLLYGLDRARKPIRATDQAVIVEGYMDVIALHQAGFENVISPMGTALTEDQLRLLKRFSKRIVLALDPDAAGQAAVLRGLDAARQSLDREGEISFDARGLLRHESRLQADLRVATMPDELDPDEIVQRDAEEWKRLIENAQPIVTHVMGALAAGRDLEDVQVKADIVAQVLPLIEDLPDPVVRDSYQQKLARFLRVDERALIGRQVKGPRTRRPRPKGEATTPSEPLKPKVAAVSPSHKIGAHCLSLLLRRPDLLYRLDRVLQEAGLSRLSPEDFEYTDHQMLFRLVRQSLEQDAHDADQYLHQNLPAALSDLTDDLLAKSATTNSLPLDPVDDRLLEDLFRGVIKIRRLGLDENINQLRFLQEDAQQQGDLRAASYLEMVSHYQRSRNALDQASLKLTERRQE
ncbi:MAG: DNA primase [Anaerolineales bacterium]|nr:DNA primase [Anaerolineales bacterium]